MRFKQFLQEKTFAIGQDVDFIYNKAYKKFFNALQKGDKNPFKFLSTVIISSSDLKSKQSKKADKINPIKIYCEYDQTGNYYSALQNLIHLTPNVGAIQIHLNHQQPENTLQFDAFENELNGVKMKNTIYHELSHWLDDTLHNFHIKKNIKHAYDFKDNPKKFWKIRKEGHEDINATDIEINAQIHAIKQLKRQYRKEWNELNFKTMIRKDGSLYAIFKSLSPKERNEWVKKLLSRMHREKLLGKNMRKGI
jgi:hypothetical protein